MTLDIAGRPANGRKVRAGFIGCGSHAFRNVYPALQFAAVDLVATCDLDADRAAAFARQFGARASYADHRKMLEAERLDAVFIVTNYDAAGRPRYPGLAADCLRAGRHVWMEKPPAASCDQIEALMALAGDRLSVMVGFKKMFAPANVKAAELMRAPDFGRPSLVTLQYPTLVPTVDDLRRYRGGERVESAVGFLDHLCHPVSLLLMLMGMPRTLYYERAASGAGVALFTFESGAVCSLALTHGAAHNGGMERTCVVSDRRGHVTVENNERVTYHRDPPPAPGTGYGTAPDFFVGTTEQTSAVWQPEFSLGQLYNKALFLLGYWPEVQSFAQSVLDGRRPTMGTLTHAWQATRIFEAFAEGPGRVIALPGGPGAVAGDLVESRHGT